MADTKKQLTSLGLTLALLALNLIAFNLLLAGRGSLRADLTEEGVYSISPATRRMLSALEEDVLVYGFFSRRTHPKLAPLVPRIQDLLKEYRAISNGRVQVEMIDPREDEAAEQEAGNRFGVESTPFRLASKYEAGIVNAYFAIVVKYGDQYVRYGFEDLIEVEPLPDGDIDVRLRNLEYDLTRAIKKTVYGFQGSAELFERVDGKVALTALISPQTLPEVFKEIPDAVREAAAQLREQAGDKFEFVEIDPSEDEVMAQQVSGHYGVGPMTLGLFGGERFYLYGFLETPGGVEQLDLAGEGLTAASIREAIENALRRQTPGFLKTVGVVSPGPPQLPPELLMQLQMQGRMPPQPPPEFQQIKLFLGRDYEVRDVDLDADAGVPSEIDTLLVLKPVGLDERAVYHLDQYLMRGGRMILCAGNYAADFDPSGLRVSPVDSGLDDWLEHLGVEIPATLVLDDRNQPLPIPELQETPFGTIRTWRMAPYPYLVEVRDEGLVNRQITSRLSGLGVYWASPVRVEAEKTADLEVVEILRSSKLSWTDDDTSRVSFVDYTVPQEGLAPQLLAVALNGEMDSYFSGREAPRDESDDAAAAAPTDVPLERSPQTRLVVIGNAEFLSDFVARALGTAEGGFFAENLAFMQNLIDWINMDNDLIGIRARGTGVRRLDRIEPGTEVAIEAINYAVPVLALLALGLYQLWRRRNAVAMLAEASPGGPAGSGRTGR